MADDDTDGQGETVEPQPPTGAPLDFHDRRIALERRMKPTWIHFARLVAEGMPKIDAYAAAYPGQGESSQRDTLSSGAARLFGYPVVRDYVELLTGAAFERSMIDIEGIYRRLEQIALTEDREKALGPAVRAAEILIDRARGGVPKDVRKEVSGPGGKPVEIRHSGGMSDATVDEVKRKMFGLPEAALKEAKVSDGEGG